jgi:hypothetical protein
VGAAGLAILAAAVQLVGRLANSRAQAETLAMIGFFSFAVYACVAYLLTTRLAARG